VKVAIIGGSGKMGRWFASFMQKDGREVVISGRNQDKLRRVAQELGVETASNVEAVKAADIVLLSVSIDNFEDVVKEISPHTSPRQIIIDITSTKVVPVTAMHRYIKAGRVLGTHPLFGPGASGVAGQNFILTPTSEDEEGLAQRVREYLEARGARVSLMSPQEHDDIMTVILGLSHFIAIVSADTLISSEKMKKVEAFGGITYKVLLTLAESVLTEDPELYASLQMGLPGVTEVERLFLKKAGEWTDMVAGKDRRKFVQRMADMKDKLAEVAPDFEKSYENMYKIAENL